MLMTKYSYPIFTNGRHSAGYFRNAAYAIYCGARYIRHVAVKGVNSAVIG